MNLAGKDRFYIRKSSVFEILSDEKVLTKDKDFLIMNMDILDPSNLRIRDINERLKNDLNGVI